MLYSTHTTWVFLLVHLSHKYQVQGQKDTTSSSDTHISGSLLKSGVWYSIDMSGFSPGHLTWTTKETENEKESVQWYLYHVFKLDAGTSAKFQKDGSWYETTLWQFLPSGRYPDWYKMRNARFPDSYVTWRREDSVSTHPVNKSHYLVLEKGRDEADYMLKPVFTETQEDGTDYHQLIMRHFPKGMINWSRQNDTGHLIQNHHAGTDEAMERYNKGHDYYDDTLFSFTEVMWTRSENPENAKNLGKSLRNVSWFCFILSACLFYSVHSFVLLTYYI